MLRALGVDIPVPRYFQQDAFSVVSPNSLFDLVEYIGNTWTSAVWPTANTAIFVPFEVYSPVVITRLFVAIGAASSGNIDMGIYDLAGNRLVSAGSTAMGTLNLVQVFDVTDLVLAPGVYYLGCAVNNTTGTTSRFSAGTVQTNRVAGIQEVASAFPLPATVTFGNPANSYIPSMGCTSRGVL